MYGIYKYVVMPMPSSLTEKQVRFLEFILDYREEQGTAPTIQEMADHFGYASPGSVQRYLEALEKKGYIRRRERLARGVELIWENVRKVFWQRMGIPVVGRVAAGSPILAEANIEEVLDLQDLFPNDDELFALRVEGDSMVEAGILEGDLVVLRPQPTADSGQIVAAIVDNGEPEGTVKRFNRRGDQVVLEPANPNYQPIVADDVRIVGVALGVVRRFGASHTRRLFHER